MKTSPPSPRAVSRSSVSYRAGARVVACFQAVLFCLASSSLMPADAATPPRPACPPADATDHYFAVGALEPTDAQRDAYRRGSYSRHLAAMDEPSLSCGVTGLAYRFTWLRSFHHPIAIRVFEHDGRMQLVATELDGAGGYASGAVLRRSTRALTDAEATALRAAFAELVAAKLPPDEFGFDGSEWVLEHSEPGVYQVVARWSPDAGPVRALGLRFLELAGWTVPPDEIY